MNLIFIFSIYFLALADGYCKNVVQKDDYVCMRKHVFCLWVYGQ